MTPTTLVAVVDALALLHFIARVYQRDIYVCPVCGTKREDRHADECPWSRGG